MQKQTTKPEVTYSLSSEHEDSMFFRNVGFYLKVHTALLPIRLTSKYMYEGESNENRKNFFKFNLLNESGTQLYHFST
jgi:hypothetical protein